MAIVAPKDLRWMALVAMSVGGVACGHTDPFSTPPYGSTEPFDPSPPVRLTRNPGPDREASWLPGASGILYASQQLGRRDRDVCLAELPPAGGAQRRLVCDFSVLGGDTLNAVEWPAATDDGRLAFVKAGNPTNATMPVVEAVAVGSGLDPRSAAEVQRLPYTLPGEPRHNTVTHLRWLSPTQLVFVGSLRGFRAPCMFCSRVDTIVTGLKAVVLDLATPAVPPVAIPGTDYATGVSPGPSTDELYYTVGGDSRVYRRSLSSGEVGVVYDFGAAGIARDVHAVGTRFAAVVGGHVTFAVDTLFGPVQWDSGGVIHVVDLSAGTDQLLVGPGLFRHPALSPDGDRLVAEVPVTSPLSETSADLPGDLLLFTVP